MGKPAREILEDKKYDRLIIILADRFGADEMAVLLIEAEQRLDGYLATTRSLSDGERMHAEGFVYPMCALYLAIAERCDRDDALGIVSAFMRETALRKGTAIQKALNVPGARRIFMKVFGVMGAKLFGESAGFEQKMHSCTSSYLRMDILSCPYLRHATAAGTPEIAPLFCANDEYAYGDLPGISFHRTGTLANGADRCDFELRLV